MLTNEQINESLDLVFDFLTSSIEIWLESLSVERIREILTVDKLKLDDASEQITQEYYFFGLLQSWANDSVDIEKANLERVSARLDASIRESPESYNIEKVTEKGVASLILLQPEYLEAENAYQKAKVRAGAFYRMMNALDKKAKAIETLTKQYLGDYYTLTRELPDKVKEDITTTSVRKNEEEALSKSPRLKKRQPNE